MGGDGGKVDVGGASFWHTTHDGERIELNNRDDIAVDSETVAWTVAPITAASGETIRSNHRAARFLVQRVIDAKRRQAARRRPVRSVPKPAPTSPGQRAGQVSADALVPCPHCGEGWHECPLCDGDGCVTRRAAESWLTNQG